ncbi:hypothetical protein MG293_018601 [Ovis ammon polii]|uniref:Uncharacterized protein n=1 Tax=Ovis ammon polii TaxID=230172 RepID=A0AAD4Y147_OVIAM|nr:hypothetical protein MG293_018601 [Ovis ammon polii]
MLQDGPSGSLLHPPQAGSQEEFPAYPDLPLQPPEHFSLPSLDCFTLPDARSAALVLRYALYDSWSLEPWSWDCGRGDCSGHKTDFRQALAVPPPITLQKLACPQVTDLRTRNGPGVWRKDRAAGPQPGHKEADGV